MTPSEDLTSFTNYQFPPWSNSLTRPHSSTSNRESSSNDPRSLSIDNRSSPDPTKSKKRIIRHHVRIPTFSRISSPVLLPQRTMTPEALSTHVERAMTVTIEEHRTIPIPVKSTEMNLPLTMKKMQNPTKNFPKQIYEHNQITFERKKRKQQAQNFTEKYSQTETWMHLRKSFAELKRHAVHENTLLQTSIISANTPPYSSQTAQQNQSLVPLKSDSVGSSTFSSSVSRSDNSSFNVHSQTKHRSNAEPLTRIYIDPLLVGSKPIHPLFVSSHHPPHPRKTPSPSKSPRTAHSARPRSRILSSFHRKSSPDKRRQMLTSELSQTDRSGTPTSPRRMIKDIESSSRPMTSVSLGTTIAKTSIQRRRLPSSIEINMKNEFHSIPPIRSRSANDIKTIRDRVKTPSNPKFLVIADEEHRIESWFHQYPFVLADELIKAFRSKNPSRFPLLGYFTDEYQTLNSNLSAKTCFQGKQFHIHHDWKKFDLIFVSKPVASEIISPLQSIFQSLKSLKKTIPIHEVDHHKELKKQIKVQCRSFQGTHQEK